MNEFFIKKVRKVKFKNPILIEGLPGVGNVARIVVDYLIEKLNAKKCCEIYSYYFPNTIFLSEENEIELPKVEVYYHKGKRNDLIFVVGDVQPAEEYASYLFSEKIVEFAKENKVKEIITLGGIATQSYDKPDVYGAVTDKSYISKLKKVGVRFDRKGAVVLIGAAGLILGLAKLKKMKGFTLLSDTNPEPTSLGFNAAKAILNVLIKYLKLKISVKDLELKNDHEPKTIPKIKKKILKKLKVQQPYLTYIG